MGAFAIGQVVVLPFPFSNLEQNKNRPALLLANVGRGDWIVCQITSKSYADKRAIEISDDDFSTGSLQRLSYARAGKLFTAHESLFSGIAGKLKSDKLQQIKNAVIEVLNHE